MIKIKSVVSWIGCVAVIAGLFCFSVFTTQSVSADTGLITVDSITSSTFYPGSSINVNWSATGIPATTNFQFTFEIIKDSDNSTIASLGKSYYDKPKTLFTLPKTIKDANKKIIPLPAGSYKIRIRTILDKKTKETLEGISPAFTVIANPSMSGDGTPTLVVTNPTGGTFVKTATQGSIKVTFTSENFPDKTPATVSLVNESNDDVVAVLTDKTIAIGSKKPSGPKSISKTFKVPSNISVGSYRVLVSAPVTGADAETAYSLPFDIINQNNTKSIIVTTPYRSDAKGRGDAAGRQILREYYGGGSTHGNCFLQLRKNGQIVNATRENGLFKFSTLDGLFPTSKQYGTLFAASRNPSGVNNATMADIYLDPDIVAGTYQLYCVKGTTVDSMSNEFEIIGGAPGALNPTSPTINGDASDIGTGNNDVLEDIPVTATSTLVLDTPNGRESYKVGGVAQIKWHSSNLTANTPVTFQLEDTRFTGDVASHYSPILGYGVSVPNAGAYSWVIPESLGNGSMKLGGGNVYKLTVATNDGLLLDTSDSLFVIASSTSVIVPPAIPSIAISNPNGGATYKAGNIINTQWRSSNIPATTLLNFDLVNLAGTPIRIMNGVRNDGAYTVTIPASIPAGAYKLLVSTNDAGASATDYSDQTFDITAATVVIDSTSTSTSSVASSSIKITNIPNKNFKSGNPINLQWKTVSGTAPTTVSVTLVNSAGDAILLKNNIKNSNYTTITIPAGISNGAYRVRVYDENTEGYSNAIKIENLTTTGASAAEATPSLWGKIKSIFK